MKKLYLLLFLLCVTYGQESIRTQQKNVLYIQNLIGKEEAIAKETQQYILDTFTIPTLNELKTNKYLGSTFSLVNKMGGTIAFKDSSKLQIKYAITKSFKPYVDELYKRDLYRYRTSVYLVKDAKGKKDINNSYVELLLISKEAQSLYDIIKHLKSGESTKSSDDCSSETTLKSTYCIDKKRENIIRYFDTNGKWIDYDKKDFEKGDISIQDISLITSSKMDDLAVGTYIFIQNGDIYMKTINYIDSTTKILKVE